MNDGSIIGYSRRQTVSSDHAEGRNRPGSRAEAFEDNREAQGTVQMKQGYLVDNRATHSIQRKANNTDLPDHLKSGIEQLSGIAMDDVKVHYNSAKPAQLNAHAYAQGNQIHVASGQEKHLAHEAWHVVQQKQGRVKPTLQMMGKVNVNDDAALEREADVMGAKSVQRKSNGLPAQFVHPAVSSTVVQRNPTDSIANVPIAASYAGMNNNQRLAEVKKIMDYLVAQGVLNLRDTGANQADILLPGQNFQKGQICIQIGIKQGSATALTYHDGSSADEQWYFMMFSDHAFKSGPILHSTIRHELIHIGQRLLVPELPVGANDELMHEYNDNVRGNKKALKSASSNLKKTGGLAKGYGSLSTTENHAVVAHVGKETAGPGGLQEALQEIETHAWEIEHAQETGIPPDYVQETYDHLKVYETQLNKNVKYLTKLQTEHWDPYIQKAYLILAHIHQLMAPPPQQNQNQNQNQNQAASASAATSSSSAVQSNNMNTSP